MNSSLTFTLQIQWICASSLCHRLFCVAAVKAQVSTACSITLFTHVEYTLSLSARGRLRLVRRAGTVQSRVFFTSPLTPADSFSKPPADPRTCPLSIPPRDTLIPPRIRRGPAVVPPDTCLIPPRIRGGLTMSNDDVIMIVS